MPVARDMHGHVDLDYFKHLLLENRMGGPDCKTEKYANNLQMAKERSHSSPGCYSPSAPFSMSSTLLLDSHYYPYP